MAVSAFVVPHALLSPLVSLRQRCVWVGDLSEELGMRRVDKSEAERFATRINGVYFETSAKTGQQVTEVFNYIGDRLTVRLRLSPSLCLCACSSVVCLPWEEGLVLRCTLLYANMRSWSDGED